MTTTPCKLRATPLDPKCDFRSTPGKVTLTIENLTGTVLFAEAEYNGKKSAPPPADTITIELVEGRHRLDIVYAFSDPAHGKATLKEGCTNSTPLITIKAADNPVAYFICAEVRP
jgi:hypothetical protein